MPGYREVSWVAAGLLTDVATLLDFDRKGWIKTVERNGTVFLAADQKYRARYILYLRRKRCLSDEQIELVLSVQQPPYSAAAVDLILQEQARTPRAAETSQPGESQPGIDGPG